jgi:hypothetical protein
VTDGDSVVVRARGNERIDIRLDGVDCPELGKDFGRRAKQFTSDLLFGRTVGVAPKSIDRNGCTVARVDVGGRDASITRSLTTEGQPSPQSSGPAAAVAPHEENRDESARRKPMGVCRSSRCCGWRVELRRRGRRQHAHRTVDNEGDYHCGV